MLGLKLETYFDNADECTNAIVYTLDDYTYLQNNVTLSKGVQWEAPFFNFTRAIAGNFSSSIVQCEIFGVNWWEYNVEKFAEFDNNVGTFILSFLFNLMGNSLSFKSIFNEIQDDMSNQYYADIAYQYGRLIRLIFDFDPVSLSSLLASDDIRYE